jgi:hypothetical protein
VGTTLESFTTRFIAPALPLPTLRSSIERDGRGDASPDGERPYDPGGSGKS